MQSGSGPISSASPWRFFGALSVREVRYRAAAVQRRHRHQESSLSLVLNGELEETSPTMSHRAAAGSVVIKPAECWHADVYGPCGVRLVQVRPKSEDDLWDRAFCSYGWLDSPRFAAGVLGLMNGRVGAGESAEMIFWDIVESVFPFRTNPPTAPPPVWWSDALDLLGQCTEQSISVGDVALRVGVHPVHLVRVFRALFGCTVRQYIRERRVLAAWRACQTCDASLAAIAIRSGFADQAHMTRAFTEVLGIPPGRLRRLCLRSTISL
jgi:AraC family transcriptional regulator